MSRASKGERNGSAKLTQNDVEQVIARLAHGEPGRQLAIELNVSVGTIKRIANGTGWAHISRENLCGYATETATDDAARTEKTCSRCRLTKSMADFSIDRSSKDGCSRYCRPCHKMKQREYKNAHPGYARERKNRWRMRDPDKHRSLERARRQRRPLSFLLQDARRRARLRGLPFNITVHDLVIPERCPDLGIKIEVGGPRRSWPSIDRIRPELGYVRGNVRVISLMANAMKRDATAEEMCTIARAWLRLFGDAVCSHEITATLTSNPPTSPATASPNVPCPVVLSLATSAHSKSLPSGHTL
jgi:hypothetical protein